MIFGRQNISREIFDMTVAIDERDGGARAKSFDSWIAIGGVTNEGEIVRNEFRTNAELSADCCFITNFIFSAIDLHNAIRNDALSKIFIGRPDANLLDALISSSEMRACCQSIVGFEFNHGPNDYTHRRQR